MSKKDIYDCGEGMIERVMNKKGLMYNPGGHYLSRDWEDIPCKRESCESYSFGKCGVPSRCKIGWDGKCEGFELKETHDGQ